MRNIFAMIFVLCLSLSAVCTAFDPPDPNRWYWLGSNDRTGTWIDTKTINRNTIGNTRFGDAWVMIYDVESNSHTVSHWKYNLSVRTIATMGYVQYDSNGKLVDSYNPDYLHYNNVFPDTIAEAVMFFIESGPN